MDFLGVAIQATTGAPTAAGADQLKDYSADGLDLQRARFEGTQSTQRSETEILGVNHAELGRLMVQRWGLPEVLQLGVAYHHAPEEGGGTRSATSSTSPTTSRTRPVRRRAADTPPSWTPTRCSASA